MNNIDLEIKLLQNFCLQKRRIAEVNNMLVLSQYPVTIWNAALTACRSTFFQAPAFGIIFCLKAILSILPDERRGSTSLYTNLRIYKQRTRTPRSYYLTINVPGVVPGYMNLESLQDVFVTKGLNT
jgi:hypothetical protein